LPTKNFSSKMKKRKNDQLSLSLPMKKLFSASKISRHCIKLIKLSQAVST